MADNGTQRVIMIQEYVEVTLDCTEILQQFIIQQPNVTVYWNIRRLQNDLMTLGSEGPLFESSLPLVSKNTQYVSYNYNYIYILIFYDFFLSVKYTEHLIF